jgi:hypothetical protein
MFWIVFERSPEMPAKFPLGRVMMTRGVADTIALDDVFDALVRHMSGNWGEVCEDDRRENGYSLKVGFRLLSVYRTTDGTRLWVITEADRSATTVLLPSEY